MVKILIVEDEEDFFESIQKVFDENGLDCEITWARSKETAISEAERQFFDLTILDQKIPTLDGALDAHVDHGRAAWDTMFECSPGMPVLILTALSADDIIDTVVRRNENQRIWGGEEKFPTVDHLRKVDFDRFPTKIIAYANAVQALKDVEFQLPAGLELEEQHKRLCALFARRIKGVRCDVRRLSGGLSGSAVYRVMVFDNNGARIQNAVLKIGSKQMVETERSNLQLMDRLAAVATPRFLETLYYGAKNMAAIAYQLADGYEQNVFDLLDERHDDLPKALQCITDQRQNWVNATSERRATVGEIRRLVLSDESVETIVQDYELVWIGGFEAREIQVHWGCIHGDFHGENILLNEELVPVFIDYGDVKEGPTALDWMTLENSTFFHPSAPGFEQAVIDSVRPEKWASVEEYCCIESLGVFISECRKRAEVEGLYKRELVASAYSYVLRQLKYPDTDKELAVALLEGLRATFDE